MANVNPLLLVGAVIGVVTALLVLACALVKDKKETMNFERTMNDGEILRRLAGYAKPYLAKFVVVLFLMLFSIAYDIISPLIVGALEELVSGEFELPRLFVGVAVYAGVLVFSMASTYFQAVILQRVGQRIISDLREDLFTHIESLSHEQLNEIPVGKLVTRVTNDTNAISMMFTNLLVTLTKNIFVILGILVAMLALNYELTLMVLCFVPFIVIFTVIFRKFSRRAYRKVKDATTDINTYLSENLSGIKVTQIFGREDEKMAEFREKSQRLARANREQIFVFGVFRPLVYMLYICSILCLFYLGGMGHLNGVTFLGQTITGGTIVTFYMYISKFFTPIQNLAEQFNWLQSALASSEKVFSIMDIAPKMVDVPDAIELDEVKGEIEFRDVWFSYLPGEWVLQGVSFHIDPHQTVAFVGSTGSGKSTTLYATLRRLNALTDNILTIEDPIEYTLEGVNQVQLKEEIGLTFTAALRTFLRQDPDIIMLGEIRDGATAEMAVRSSLTGHLLFSTIHTNTAWGAVARLSDMGVHPYLVADTLVMTVAQRLARLLCPHCKRHAEATDEVRRLLPGIAIDRYCEPVGCERCFYTGYAGRRAVYEVIPMDDELAASVRSGRTDVAPLLFERGIPSLRDAVVDLFRRGQTSLDEVIPLLNY